MVFSLSCWRSYFTDGNSSNANNMFPSKGRGYGTYRFDKRWIKFKPR